MQDRNVKTMPACFSIKIKKLSLTPGLGLKRRSSRRSGPKYMQRQSRNLVRIEMQVKQKGQAFLTWVEMGRSEHLLMRCGHVVPAGGGLTTLSHSIWLGEVIHTQID